MAVGVAIVGLSMGLLGCDDAKAGKAEAPSTPDGTVRAVANGLQADQPRVVWDALPDTYQQDVTDLIHIAAEKMDAELYDKVFGVLRKTTTVLKEKKHFILESSLAKKDVEHVGNIQESWDAAVGIADAIVQSDLARVESLKTLDPGAFLATSGGTILRHMRQLSEVNPQAAGSEFTKLQQVQVRLVKQEGQTATVELMVPGERAEQMAFVKVGGKWLPEPMVSAWKTTMQEAKQRIAAVEPAQMQQYKLQTMMALAMIETFVDRLALAKTQEEFDGIFTNLVGGFLGQAFKN
jgi:hypothetical protein